MFDAFGCVWIDLIVRHLYSAPVGGKKERATRTAQKREGKSTAIYRAVEFNPEIALHPAALVVVVFDASSDPSPRRRRRYSLINFNCSYM